MTSHFFDDADETSGAPRKPFWALNFDDEEAVLGWLNAELDALKEQARERHEEQRKNLAAYRGIQYRSGEQKASRVENAAENSLRSKNPRVIYNHLVDMVEQDVSRMTKYRGAISAVPASDDNGDRIVAGVAEDLIETLWDKLDIDSLAQKHRRRVRILGEDYVGVFWNPSAGPYDPDWVKAILQKAGIKGDPAKMKRHELRKALRSLKDIPRLPLLDDEGKQLRGSDGEPLWIDRPLRRGDVEHRLMLSWDVFMQRVPSGDYDFAEYGFYRERQLVDTVKAQHPSKAHKIEEGSSAHYFDLDTCELVESKGEIEVWHFFHRSTDMLDQGRWIKFVRGALLKGRTNPYRGHDDRAIFPWVRTVDIDTPAVMNGDATVTHGRGPQAVYNNLVSLRVRNRFNFSHPKWMVPQGSVDTKSLGNNSTIVSYKGPTPPNLSQPAISEANESAMMQEAKGDLQQIMGVYGVSRGDPPAGITSGIALTFLDEQEADRANVGIQSHTRALKQIALQDLWLIADNYDHDRLADLLGQNRAAQLDSFEMANLRDVADLRVQNHTALPQQRSARMEYIVKLRETAPSVMPDEMLVDALGLGEEARFRSIATVAIRKADDENEAMMNGGQATPPREHEFHLQHYRRHISQMNEPSYEKLPDSAKEAFEEHVMGHELVLWQWGLKNPQFAALVMQEFPGFPVYYVPEAALPAEPTLPASMPLAPPPAPGMPPSVEPGLAPGLEAAVPPPEMQAPGAEALMPPEGVV